MSAPPPPGGVPLEVLTRAAAGIFVAAAGVIHLLHAPSHFEDDLIYGWFFLLVGCAQLGGGLALLRHRSAGFYLGLASANVAVLAVWALTRTAGVPLGLRAGIVEPAGAADLASGALEAVGAALLLALGGPLGDRGFWKRALTGRAPAAAILALATATGALVVFAERNNRTICHHHNPSFGPLAAVSGHSILPEGRPPVIVEMGRSHLVLAGFLVNCGSSAIEVTKAAPLSSAGDSAVIAGMSMLPAAHRPLEYACGREEPGKKRIVVPPSVRRPEVAVYMRVEPVAPGTVYLNAVNVTFTHGKSETTQPLATAVEMQVRPRLASGRPPGC